MNPALDGANFKLSRALEHLHVLTDEMVAFRERDPYRVIVEFEPDTGWWVAKARISEEPSPGLSVLVGEIAYECLSALNHLVWELAARKVGRNKVAHASLKNRVQFPVAYSTSHWANVPLVRDRLVSNKALALIDELQPYHGWYGPEGVRGHPLALIKDIADSDKHRVLAVAFAHAEFSEVGWLWDYERAQFPESEWLARPNQPLHEGSPLARIRFKTGNDRANVTVGGKPTADVLFDTDNWWIRHSTLLTCTTWTQKAWQRLAPLFPPK